MTDTRAVERWILAVLVLIHLGIAFVHGRAHDGAHVELSSFSTLVVVAAVIAGPLIGLLVLMTFARRAGAWLLAVSMAAACVFGLVKHFMLQSADHVSQVGGTWGTTFAITAVLLALTEAAATGLSLRQALYSRRVA